MLTGVIDGAYYRDDYDLYKIHIRRCLYAFRRKIKKIKS